MDRYIGKLATEPETPFQNDDDFSLLVKGVLPFSNEHKLPFDDQSKSFRPDRNAKTSLGYLVCCAGAPFQRNVLQFQSIEKYFPRRLLHIPSLTSYERDSQGYYNGINEPPYSTLSYTWGRYQTHECIPSLPVKGITWEVPKIQESHFTPDQFRRALSLLMYSGIEWAWVDIACIDQVDTSIKMDEVGRQAAIFGQADLAFVWLSRVSNDDCFKALSLIDRVSWLVVPGGWEGFTPEESLILLRYLLNAFSTVCGDPWFSSLWTLQEFVLRNDAMIISSDGHILTECNTAINARGGIHSLSTFYKEQVMNRPRSWSKVSNVWTSVVDSIRTLERQIRNYSNKTRVHFEIGSLVTQITTVVNSTGALETYGNNPNILFSLSKSRTTTYPEDRIYAIMQIYNIRVGRSIRVHDSPSLAELRDEFGYAINCQSLVQGQAFVHTVKPKPGKSWCITEDSFIPAELKRHDFSRIHSRISRAPSGEVQITGRWCLFAKFLEVHHQYKCHLEDNMALYPIFFLDKDVADRLELGPEPNTLWDEISFRPLIRLEEEYKLRYKLRQNDRQSLARQLKVSQDLFKLLGPDNLLIIDLADADEEGTNSERKPGWTEDHYLPLSRRHIGLIVHQTQVGELPDCYPKYERLGVLEWAVNPMTEQWFHTNYNRDNIDFSEELIAAKYLKLEFLTFSYKLKQEFSKKITIILN
ncbi:heterokaryon incompatibility protein-domain-containing protein [Nemania serpens]|nr:heterokaryon incompatibility protein-domain-containing protein [Nemania serpens]